MNIAPSKPFLIGEFNSYTDPRKPQWLLDLLDLIIQPKFRAIRAIELFNWNPDKVNDTWALDVPSQAAWREGIGKPHFLAAGDWISPPGTPLLPAPFSAGLVQDIPLELKSWGNTWDEVTLAMAKELTRIKAEKTDIQGQNEQLLASLADTERDIKDYIDALDVLRSHVRG
jgi:hypothetical protein